MHSSVLARQIPGFGGFYVRDSVVHAVLTDAAAAPKAQGILRALAASDAQLRARVRQPASVVAVAGEYTFAELGKGD
jgi:hypothetical protein